MSKSAIAKPVLPAFATDDERKAFAVYDIAAEECAAKGFTLVMRIHQARRPERFIVWSICFNRARKPHSTRQMTEVAQWRMRDKVFTSIPLGIVPCGNAEVVLLYVRHTIKDGHKNVGPMHTKYVPKPKGKGDKKTHRIPGKRSAKWIDENDNR